MPPLVVLALSMALVVALIVVARAHAFLALLAGALVVGLASPAAVSLAQTASVVATEFGTVTGRIGIVIALASIVGLGLHRSGGAARISEAFLQFTGERRAYLSLWGSGFVLSIPVFFDTVFYLLAPIARAMYRRTGKQYGLYISTTVASAAATHVFVPPTPGPLAVGATLGADLGLLIVVSLVVALPASLAGVAYGVWASRSLTRDVVPVVGPDVRHEEQETGLPHLPALLVALLPIVLPVVLIASKTTVTAMQWTGAALAPINVLGDPNVALLISAVVALWMVKRASGCSLRDLGAFSEQALAGAGSIILITAAGGAYGGLLTRAGVGDSLAAIAATVNLPVMVMAYLVAALIKGGAGVEYGRHDHNGIDSPGPVCSECSRAAASRVRHARHRRGIARGQLDERQRLLGDREDGTPHRGRHVQGVDGHGCGGRDGRRRDRDAPQHPGPASLTGNAREPGASESMLAA